MIDSVELGATRKAVGRTMAFQDAPDKSVEADGLVAVSGRALGKLPHFQRFHRAARAASASMHDFCRARPGRQACETKVV